MIATFHGRVDDNGHLLLRESERDQRRVYLHGLRDQAVEITIRKERTQRSLAQNNWIHLAASALADHCGYSLAEMKLILMGECWGWQTVGDHELPVKIHTADMTVEEANSFIEWLVPWATEKFPECQVSYPDEFSRSA